MNNGTPLVASKQQEKHGAQLGGDRQSKMGQCVAEGKETAVEERRRTLHCGRRMRTKSTQFTRKSPLEIGICKFSKKYILNTFLQINSGNKCLCNNVLGQGYSIRGGLQGAKSGPLNA